MSNPFENTFNAFVDAAEEADKAMIETSTGIIKAGGLTGGVATEKGGEAGFGFLGDRVRNRAEPVEINRIRRTEEALAELDRPMRIPDASIPIGDAASENGETTPTDRTSDTSGVEPARGDGSVRFVSDTVNPEALEERTSGEAFSDDSNPSDFAEEASDGGEEPALGDGSVRFVSDTVNPETLDGRTSGEAFSDDSNTPDFAGEASDDGAEPARGDGSVRFVSETINSGALEGRTSGEAFSDGAGGTASSNVANDGPSMWLPVKGGRGGSKEVASDDGFFGSFFDQAKDAVDQASGRSKGGDAGDRFALVGKDVSSDKFADLRGDKDGEAEKAGLEPQADLLKGVFEHLSDLKPGKDKFDDQAFDKFGGRPAGENSGASAKDVAFAKDAPPLKPDFDTDLGDDKPPSSFNLFS